MQRYRVNFPLLIGLLVGTVVILGGGFGIWVVQQARNAGRLLSRAEEARAEGDHLEAAKMYGRYLAIRDNDQEAMAELAQTYADLAEEPDVEPKAIRTALGLLENTVREQPDNTLLRRRLVDMLMSRRVRMLKPALDHISQLVNQNPGDTELQVMRSECLFASNDPKAIDHAYELIGYNEEADVFDTAVAKAPNEPPIYRRLAVSLRRDRNERELADRVIDQMVEANEADGQAHLLRSQYRLSFGDDEEAKEDLDRALEISPDDPSVVMATSDWEIRSALKLEEEDFESEDALYDAKQAHFDRARELLTECLEKNPDNSELYRRLAAVEVRENDYEGAIELYERGIAAVPPRRSQMLWFSKARLQIERSKLKDARVSIKEMREAEYMPPPFIDYLAARLKMTESKWFDAAKEFDRLSAYMSDIPGMSTELNFLLGLCYEKLGQFEKALGAYNVALQADPLSKVAEFGRTRALNAMGQASRDADNLTLYALMQDELDKPESEQDWDAFDVLMERYVENLELGDAMLAVLRGEVYMRRGLYNDARLKLMEAFKLAPKNLAVRRAAVKLYASDPSQGPVKALKLLDKVVDDFGDMPILRLERADLLIAVNDEDLIEQLFALTRGIDEWDDRQKTQLWDGMAQKFARLRDRQSQMVALQKVAEYSPNELQTIMRLFMMAREAADEVAMDNAQKRVLAIVGDKDDPTYRLTEAYQVLYRNQGESKENQKKAIAEAEELVEQALADRPEWSELHIARANLALMKGDERRAVQALDRAATLGRPTTLSLYQHVKLLSKRGRYADALREMKKVTPDARFALLGRDYAEALFRTGEVPEAIAAAKRFAESASNNGTAQLWYGRFLSQVSTVKGITDERRTSLREEAGAAFVKASELAPKSAEVWLALVTFLATTGDVVAAEERIREAQLALPEDQTQLMFARCYEVIGRFVDAEALYTQVVEESDESAKPRAMRLLAAFYLGPGYPKPGAFKTKMATPLINGILRRVAEGELPANDASAQWARSTAARVFAKVGEYQALRDAERLLSSNVIDGELAAADRLLMAEILAARPEPVSRLKAVDLLEGLRKNQKMPLKTELDLARLYFSLGEWRKCREQMIEAISAYPKEPGPRQLYLGMLLKRGGPREIDQAVPQLKVLSELEPGKLSTREMIARVAHKRGKNREAAGALRSMLPKNLKSIKPEQVRLVLRVGKTLSEFKEYELATQMFRLAAEKGGATAALEEATFVGNHLDVGRAFELLEGLRKDVPAPAIVQTATAILRSPASEADTTEQLAKLRDWLDRALREDPNSVPLRLQRAETLELSKRYDESIALYQDLLDGGELKGLGRAVALNNLAYLMALSRSDDEGVRAARRYINEAVDLLGPQSDVLDTRAVILIAARDYRGAIEDLELAVIDRPSSSKFFHMANAHVQMGQLEEAAEAWERAVELGLSRESVSILEKEQFDALKSQLEGLGQRSAGL